MAEKEKELRIEDLINSLNIKKGKELYITLRKLFDQLRGKIKLYTGAELSKLLDQLKDAILNNIGTSLALYDISRCALDLRNLNEKLSPGDTQRYQKRIDNWEERIIKD